MSSGTPWSARLSQLLVAFTIELDNEFEQRMPHRTSADRGAGEGPWLVSLAMWANFLRLVPPEGVRLSELAGPAGVPKLAGLQRWGYVVVTPAPADPRPVPPSSEWLVRPTRNGRRAQQTWQPLPAEIESRWSARLGAEPVIELRDALLGLVSRLEGEDLYRYPPVLGYGLFASAVTPYPGPPDVRPDLSVLLSQVLVAFTRDFEAQSSLSLAICADVLRVLGERGLPLGDLPALGGVSKEAVAMAVGYLETGGFVLVGRSPDAPRTKLVSLTSKGTLGRAAYQARVVDLEDQWQHRYGTDVIDRLRAAVDAILQQPSAIAAGLGPYADGWRAGKHYRWQTTAMLADPLAVLPHHPMVLHRGGFPDGS